MHFEFTNKYRELTIWSIVFLLLLSLPVRFYFLEKYQSEIAIKKSVSISERSTDILARRGKITDRNGEILAEDIPSYEIGLEISKFSFNPDEISKISSLLNVESKRLKTRISKRDKKYLVLKRNASVETFLKIKAQKIKGIVGYKKYTRTYPKGAPFSQIVGVVNTFDNSGIQGIELSLNSLLTGANGKKNNLKTRKNKTIKTSIENPSHGRDIRLTLDADLQSEAYSILAKTVDEHDANSGSMVVIDPESFEILAMSNYPSFDPNDRKKIMIGTLENKAATDLFEPGSTVKPIIMAAVLQSDNSIENELINTSPGFIDYEGFITKDFKDYGTQNLSQIISNSSNVGMIKLCDKFDAETIVNGFHKMGFGKYMNEIFISTREGYLPPINKLSKRDKVSLCYGYGLQTTLLELVSSYSILYSQGKSKPLSLIFDTALDEHEQVIPVELSLKMEKMLTAVVSEGTGRRAQVKGIKTSGKTGTVKKIGNLGYEEQSLNALFVGQASLNQKNLIVGVIIRDSQVNGSGGGDVAAPSFANFINKIRQKEGYYDF